MLDPEWTAAAHLTRRRYRFAGASARPPPPATRPARPRSGAARRAAESLPANLSKTDSGDCNPFQDIPQTLEPEKEMERELLLLVGTLLSHQHREQNRNLLTLHLWYGRSKQPPEF